MNDQFNPRFANVLKLKSVAECRIFIAECKRSIKLIDEQMSIPGYGDKEWKSSAIKARDDIAHKIEMAEIRMEDMAQLEQRRNERDDE